MDTKYTPGPWAVIVERGSDYFVIPEGSTEDAICRANGHGDEMKANAVLMAAAPDLLEAVRALLTAYEYEDQTEGENSACAVAYAAIAKATGK